MNNWDLDCPFPERVRNIASGLSFGVDLDTLHDNYVVGGQVSEEEFFLLVKAAELLLRDELERALGKETVATIEDLVAEKAEDE